MIRFFVLLLGLMLLLPLQLMAQTTEPAQIRVSTFGAQLDALEVDLDVRDGSTVAHYALNFSNDSSRFAEGRIVLPVPPHSSVSELVLSGGPETLEGSIVGATEAARIYEDIVRQLIDPALLQALGGDLYEVRAFPVPQGEERQVSFSVTTPLLAEGSAVAVSVPWSRMSPRPTSATVTGDVDVSWEIRSAIAPTFALDIDRIDATRLSLGWESNDSWTGDTDFTLYLNGGEGLLDTQLLPYRLPGDDGFFALLLAPEVDSGSRVDRDVIVVIDTSGSMEGEKIVQAREAARFILDNLGEDDRFGIVSYSSSIRTFADELLPASQAGEGSAFVTNLSARGSTNISGALQTAFSLALGDRPATIIFLTDGLATMGLQDTGAILDATRQATPGRTQLFAFGVGFDVNTVLLDSLTREFVGTSHYVTPTETIDREVSTLFEQISSPVLTDVEIEIIGGKVTAVAPEITTGIFAGRQTLLTGRYGDPGEITVRVTGNSDSGRETFTYDLELPRLATGDPSIAQLWAQQRIADLLTELRLEGSRPELVEEIVEIATRFGIVTPFTSFLAVEPELGFAPPRPTALDADGRETQDQPRSQAEEALAQAAEQSADEVRGESAVTAADTSGELRAGNTALGTEQIRVLGAHSYTLIDGTWIQDGYILGQDAEEVIVGSDAFAELVAQQPDISTAAALGGEILANGPNGFVRIVWPDPDSVESVTLPDNVRTDPAAGTADGSTDPVDATDGSTDPVDGADGTVSGGTDIEPNDLTVEDPASGGGTDERDGPDAVLGADLDDGGSSGLWIGIGLAIAALVLVTGITLQRRVRRA